MGNLADFFKLETKMVGSLNINKQKPEMLKVIREKYNHTPLYNTYVIVPWSRHCICVKL